MSPKTPQIYEGQGPPPKPKRERPASYAPESVRKQALQLFEQGYGYKHVSDELGLSIHTVRDWSRAFKRGEFRVRIRKNQYRYDEEVKARVIELRRQGWTWKRIAAETGVNLSTCRYWYSLYQDEIDRLAEDAAAYGYTAERAPRPIGGGDRSEKEKNPQGSSQKKKGWEPYTGSLF